MTHRHLLRIGLLVAVLPMACRDQEPPPLYCENLAYSDSDTILMPIPLHAVNVDILKNAGADLPELAEPVSTEGQVEDTPANLYVFFKRSLANVLNDPMSIPNIPITFAKADREEFTNTLVVDVLQLMQLAASAKKRVEAKSPGLWNEIEKKFVQVAFVSAMNFSDGNPPGILFTIGSPSGKPNRYFVPIVQEDQRWGIRFNYGDLTGRTKKVHAEIEKLFNDLDNGQATADQFQQKATELIAAFLRLPFENNPELANVTGRTASPEPEMTIAGGAADRTTRTADRRGKKASDKRSARSDSEPQASEAASQPAPTPSSTSGGSIFGAVMKAARSSYQKTVGSPSAADRGATSRPAAADEAKDKQK
jgi:hypothetical protein